MRELAQLMRRLLFSNENVFLKAKCICMQLKCNYKSFV